MYEEIDKKDKRVPTQSYQNDNSNVQSFHSVSVDDLDDILVKQASGMTS